MYYLLCKKDKFFYVVYELDKCVFTFLEFRQRIMHFCFDFDACPVYSPFGHVYLTHQNLSSCALFCLNSLAHKSKYAVINLYITYCYLAVLSINIIADTVWFIFKMMLSYLKFTCPQTLWLNLLLHYTLKCPLS